MRFEEGKTYSTRKGQKAIVVKVDRGVLYGHYYLQSGQRKTTKWNIEGRHSTKMGGADLVAVYPELRIVDPPVARPEFVDIETLDVVTDDSSSPFRDLTLIPPRAQCEGWVAVFKSRDGSTFPYYKSFAQPDYERFNTYLQRKILEGEQLVRTTYVREVRHDDEDLVA